MIIDSHQHFWKYDPARHSWISDDMSILKQDFLAKDLKREFDLNDISGSVAVQADQSEVETQFLLKLATENDFIKGVVGWVDLRSSNIRERLEFFSSYNKLKGFRHIVQDEPDPEFMMKESFLNGISALSEYNFTYDILVFPKQLEATLKLVRKFPEINFVIDHISKPYIKSGQINEWKRFMLEIGKHQNVYCKISGMVTEADWVKWQYQDFIPYLDIIFQAFGARRIMFGSDFPVCLLAASYSEVKEIVDKYLNQFSKEERKLIWSENAKRFYNL